MAFLEQRLRRARTQKGVALEEVRTRLGLSPRSSGARPAKPESVTRPIGVSARSKAILDLLERACREETILKTANGAEYSRRRLWMPTTEAKTTAQRNRDDLPGRTWR